MKLSTRIPFVLALLAAPVVAQSTAKLKKELKSQERAAKKDPEALFEAGKWAKENSLTADAKRLFQKVLKYAPDHAGANEALGNELVEGKWMPAKEAEKLRAQALDAEFKSKGYVKVEGIWVEPDKAKDAKRGIFYHEGEAVTAEEKTALQKGMVRHPETGLLMDAENLDKAKNGYFAVGGGKWVDVKEADKFHSDLEHPWFIRSTHATILSTLPLAKIQELLAFADQGHETVAPLFAGAAVPPAKRPVIIIAKTQAEYRRYGTTFGDGSDVAGSFLMSDEASIRVPYQGEVRAAICENHKDWGTRYIRHAAAIAYVNALAEDVGADLPLWFVHGVGSYTSRFENDADAGWFGKQHIAKGGVGNLKAFFAGYDLNGDMESKAIAANIFQAGLMLSFATRGGNQAATDAMLTVTDALSGKGKTSASKAIDKLEKQLIKSQSMIVAHLKELVAKST